MKDTPLPVLGWREWVQLNELGLGKIKAKIDTGARTSALHAFHIRPFEDQGVQRIEFKIHPHQNDNDSVIVCTADVFDQRDVTDSGGHTEKRWVIRTAISIGEYQWPIEMTLTSRDDMRFRMLLGRKAMEGRFLVDPNGSYLVGKKTKGKTKVTG